MVDWNPTLGNTKVRVYDVSLNSVDLGIVDEPEVTIEGEFEDVVISQLHKQPLGTRLLGVMAEVKLHLREITAANLQKALFGTAGAMMPTSLGSDLYSSATPLVLHPRDMGAVTTDDIYFYKAVAVGGLQLDAADGQKDSVIPLTFRCFPDRDELPDLVIGLIGASGS